MGRALDVLGKRFDRLIVLSEPERLNPRRLLCRCDCGKELMVRIGNLRTGHTRSCGCLLLEHCDRQAAQRRTYSMLALPEYHAWVAMKQRCYDKNCRPYRNYGARGITVCAKWHNFWAFLSDVGLRPSPKHSIDRINNEGNYEPGNVRWATQSQQLANTRRTRLLTFNGETLPLAHWAKRLGMSQGTLHGRIVKRGWPVEKALSLPPITAR